ncbi:MAG: radical SAM protein [Chloroflexi bacterium]|nr:radical SAM protein [Chloroflexota bacterium]
MKVLLINPNYVTQVYGEETLDYLVAPLGLAYVAAVLKRDGVDVSLLEANALGLGMDDIEKEIKRQKPDLVGITGTTPLIARVEEIARRAKSADKGIKVVVGGPHATILPQEVLKSQNIDFCVRGEGEITALELVKALEKGGDFGAILGLGFKSNGQIHLNDSRPLIKELDSLPFPARELLPMEKYIFPLPTGAVARFTNLISSRGCPYLCTFCGQHNIWTRLVRFRSPKNVVDEIQAVKDKYGVAFVGFTDSNFPLNRKITMDICDEMAARGIKIKWACGSRVDLVDQELLRKMHKAGCQQINFGVESGNAEILKGYKKGITIDQAKTAIKQAKKAGLKVYTYFMVGGPGETRETAEETIKLA